MGVQLVFAVVAAVRRIRPVFRALELVCLDDLVAKTKLVGDLNRQPAVAFGIAGTIGRDGTRPVAERAAGDARKIRAVDTAAVRHDDRAE